MKTRSLVDLPKGLRARVSWLYLLTARMLLRKRIDAYKQMQELFGVPNFTFHHADLHGAVPS